jgi:hypothetical protein
MKQRKIILLAVAVLVGACLLFPFVSYRLADYQYEKLVQAKPATKAEVERILFLCSAKQIDIKKSAWGKTYQLESGDVCFQYLILGREPIDIVFDQGNQVKAVFSSFE